ncbi:AsnC family transcriptional regulator [Candidatus Woesearchaeota archaeon]|jgi:Lrp/AsnC family transcriptional regulator, leucine-responsive regulatory protein|nr:AsnC family transcriptional regulator [Candidatus Woesearchaeota archaeon]
MIEISTKIHKELAKNCRISVSKLARALNISRDKAENEIKKLEKEEIIKQYTINLNYNKLGFETHTILLKFKNSIIEKEINTAEKFLKTTQYITKTQKLNGEWDLLLHIVSKNSSDLHQAIKQIKQNIPLTKFKLLTIVSEYESNLETTPSKTQTKKTQIDLNFAQKKFECENYELDQIDLKLIKALKENSRASITQISKTTTLSPRIISYRISELEKKQIINYEIKLNKKLNPQKYLLFFNSNTLSQNTITAQIAISKLLNFNKITKIQSTIGDSEFIIDITATEFSEIIKLNQQINQITNTENLQILLKSENKNFIRTIKSK